MYIIKVNNLPRWISELHLKDFFRNCGEIINCSVETHKDTHRPMGHGFIEFSNNDALERAVHKDGSMLDGSKIEVKVEEYSVEYS